MSWRAPVATPYEASEQASDASLRAFYHDFKYQKKKTNVRMKCPPTFLAGVFIC